MSDPFTAITPISPIANVHARETSPLLGIIRRFPTTLPPPLEALFDAVSVGGHLRLSERTGKVALEADPEKVTPELIDALKEHREAIAALLRLREAARGGALPTVACIPIAKGTEFHGDLNARAHWLFRHVRDAYRYMRLDWEGWSATDWPGAWRCRGEELMTYSEWWRPHA